MPSHEEEQTESDDDHNKEKMSEAHIQLPLGKWSATTCIDLKLPNGIKCQKCLAADDLSSIGLRKSKSKKKKGIKNISCTQPWSTSFKESREQSKRNVYNKVWVHLIAKGYNSSDWTRYKNEEESSCACSFRRSGAIEKKNRTKYGKEEVNSISIIESVPKLNGGKPASLPSDCNKIAAIHPPPIDSTELKELHQQPKRKTWKLLQILSCTSQKKCGPMPTKCILPHW
jgi:hypothetical protein